MDNQKIGEMIKEYREAKEMSQTELAKKCGVERKTIHYIEHNKRAVNSDLIYALCDIFECSPNELFGYMLI